jgi:hypothetical protein
MKRLFVVVLVVILLGIFGINKDIHEICTDIRTDFKSGQQGVVYLTKKCHAWE